MNRPIAETGTHELEKLVHDMVAVLTADERLALVEHLYRFLREINGPRARPH